MVHELNIVVRAKVFYANFEIFIDFFCDDWFVLCGGDIGGERDCVGGGGEPSYDIFKKSKTD